LTASPDCTESLPRFWPRGFPRDVQVPATTLSANLDIASLRFPEKAAAIFFDTPLSYARLKQEVDTLAGYLQQHCGVKRGDRVALFGQSCPQFMVAYYAILRASAVVVPLNAMSTRDEVIHYLEDSGARVMIAARELLAHTDDTGLEHRLTFSYADYLEVATDLPIPAWISERHEPPAPAGVTEWKDALARGCTPGPQLAQSRDLCVLPYTSGTTGKPKGCHHTHRSMLAAVWSTGLWRDLTAETVFLGIAPMFHMLGMQNGMNLPIALGATVIIAPRWERTLAAVCIERYRVTAWTAPTAALVDFFSNPAIDQYDLSSITLMTGGGGPVPEAVAHEISRRFGITVNEGYGMSETASLMFCNPLQHQKAQCLGIPTFGVRAMIVDPETLQELPQGEVGEIVASGNQIMEGYWNNPEGTAAAFFERDGRRYLRTGDMGRIDEDGFYVMTDRLKRMINVSGFKVWPAEVETRMYEHPAVLEACVIGVQDPKQGESVKVFIVLRAEAAGQVSAADIIAWARERMATYKVPRHVEFVEKFPRASTGKILWRELS
jgi:acyl-CoA synthetase (AMP-forming)/AMP-acid ligase II